jgi:hypothetical protein
LNIIGSIDNIGWFVMKCRRKLERRRKPTLSKSRRHSHMRNGSDQDFRIPDP